MLVAAGIVGTVTELVDVLVGVAPVAGWCDFSLPLQCELWS